MKAQDKKVNDFLKELSELTEKYGIEIGGCGCCGSPYLSGKDIHETKLEFDTERKKYITY